MAIKKLVIASFNQGKIKEISQFLGKEYHLIPLNNFCDEAPKETGTTFSENALIKANFAHQIGGLPSLADDSGLEVEALGGSPGIYSARFAGKDATDIQNNTKLLQLMQGIPARAAQFQAILAVVGMTEHPIVATGTVRGEILTEPACDGGFGYDPIFYVTEMNKPASALSIEEKNRIGHRGQALRKIKKILDASAAS